MMRDMLRESMDAVRQGSDPLGVVREAAECITFDASMAQMHALS
ncbi:MAG: hypothetical protein OXU75_15250 [Deltaproteobacteria bacterium]|nr:hypothetical protein [Deltaproteobacteria bacterium]